MTERLQYWELELPKNPTEWQALRMVEYAGIKEFTKEQRDEYVEQRLGILNHRIPDESSLQVKLSDQELIFELHDQIVFDRILLNPEQRSAFRSSHTNIKFPSLEPEN